MDTQQGHCGEALRTKRRNTEESPRGEALRRGTKDKHWGEALMALRTGEAPRTVTRETRERLWGEALKRGEPLRRSI